MSIQCTAHTSNGTQCAKTASPSAPNGMPLCPIHLKKYLALMVSDDAGAVDALIAMLPAMSQPASPDAASINSDASQPASQPLDTLTQKEENTLTQNTSQPASPDAAPASQPASAKDAKRSGFEARQRAKRQRIAQSDLSSAQKETARAIMSAHDSAVNVDVKRDDDTILAFDMALSSGDKHVIALTPSDYNTRPRWLSDKEFKKAKRTFNTLYARSGAGAFQRDQDGRLIMELPMTPARYMGCVVSGDIMHVLRYSGGWRESEDGTFSMLARMDGVAPIIASVYRAGANLNRMALALDKAQIKLDSSDSDDLSSLTTKRDMARVALDVARKGFISAYMDAINASADIDASARKIAADQLAVFAADSAKLSADAIATAKQIGALA